MTWVFDFIALVKRNYTLQHPPVAPKDDDALRIGTLGAARITPEALILPARSHPGVVVTAVAARNPARAREFAQKHGIPRVFDSYQELLDDPDIDAVYNPLPNGLHYEWTMKAITAWKHVLLEKPSCNTADETRRIFQYAEEKGVLVLEAFHYRWHPAVHRVREIVQSGELGAVKRLDGALTVPSGWFPRDDVRYDWTMGGGCMMDMGVYPLSFIRWLLDAEPISVISASAIPAHTSTLSAPLDRGTTALLSFPNDVTASLTCDSATPLPWEIMPKVEMKIECERGSVYILNFVQPTAYHYVTVHRQGKRPTTEKIYSSGPLSQKKFKGEDWWTTYRYQLEAFVDKIRGREPDYWMSAEDSIKQMEAVEMIYRKSGMGVRPASTYTL
ncbi:NAD(P)-binding protein [Exidia glandulosa HHB12029]|uniref:D-xylose 1-dehydrogenase (NADP(+), D-xylono-1,5-lactone-forming) n=1 Tax=Exidia glandulosa HHB12029 TaxID=1314781 RepID=A0A166BLP8_EXIGL|nr:NAD(P)-binding protein [Exidia glandulosa HHB12029]